MLHRTLFASAALFAAPALAQTAGQTPPPPAGEPTAPPVAEVQPAPAAPATADDNATEDEDAIVVTGQRPRGSVVGDIPAENTLNARDVRAYGAASVDELIQQLAPQVGSARGRGGEAPVVLLNGRRSSGFQELRDLPPEAIERVEILPEEVALKYGYAATQRVINIVLRQRFRSTVARVQGGVPTAGGYTSQQGDLTRLQIDRNGRTTLTAHAERSGALTEAERNILLDPSFVGPDPRPFRTLRGASDQVRVGATVNRNLSQKVAGTVDLRLQHDSGRSLLGLPASGILDPLGRNQQTDSARLAGLLNGDAGKWRWTANSAAEIDITRTLTDRTEIQTDRAYSENHQANLDLTANGPLLDLPAGRSNITLRASGSTRDLYSRSRRSIGLTESDLGRDQLGGSVNVDLPVAKRNGALGAIGTLTLNANAEVEHLSDAGTLTTLGGGANWSPVARLNLIGSYTREEGAPTLNQLGDPVLEQPGVRIFDFINGTTSTVTAVTGGNPALQNDRRSVFKLGGNWQPWEATDLTFRADYVHSRLNDPVEALGAPTAALQAAFPDRFVRDASGTLLRADLRPVNFDRRETDTLRIGFNFSKPLKSKRPPQALIDQFRRARQQAQGGGGGGRPGADGAPPPPPPGGGDGGPPPGGGGFGPGGGGGGGFGGGGFGRGGGGGRGGFGQGGRLQFSLTDTVTLRDRLYIRDGLAPIDFRNGGTLGAGGGTPQHNVQAEGGYFNNGFGVRASVNYASGTSVIGGPNGDLRFSPLATTDLRFFVNPGDRFDWVLKHPWLRGTQVRLDINNIFDVRQRVRDATGAVPISYQPDLLDPVGRSVSISLRKLFLPSRFFARLPGASR
ncbi:TonB-dependent receptor plug domain-containing protein [Sphingomonas ginkgonis]|uniref:TonB-dependent receptor plug domain-containing protein n=1 Tax=Sphingomonas ginkgonis TaxID=2315330 RepID=UPI001C8C3349|nr:TonB-dependent receptor plug domain-containing protein [Sphingomonas ginkgonis]